MRKTVILIGLLCLLFQSALAVQNPTKNRKKVAVVLSGGGAKGVAHISALKVIEEAGIPIDYVVGTSMGSLIGALYSIGYTTAQMDSLVRSQDWKFLLTDASSNENESLNKREKSGQYVLTVPFHKSPTDLLAGGGVIHGRNIAILLSKLTGQYHDSIDFNKLPIPFACVSYDISKGKEYIFHSGKLALAMRSSMSIPGVFNPVKWNNMVLVDGGMSDNYPVDVARGMGADIVIGVDVADTLANANELNGLTEIIGQVVNILCANKYEENVKNSDVHIKVNIKGYSAASFSPAAIDTLLQRGETAAYDKWDELKLLKEKIGLTSYDKTETRKPYQFPKTGKTDIVKEIYPGDKPDNSLSLGIRFDNETLASLLFNTYVNINKNKTKQIDLTVRLGKFVMTRMDYMLHMFNNKSDFKLGYQFDYNDLDINKKGNKIVNYSYSRHMFEGTLLSNWRKLRFEIGARCEFFHYSDLLMPQDLKGIPIEKSGTSLISYYGHLLYSNLDKRSFPTKGMRWNINYSLYTDNFIKYKDLNAISVVSANWMSVLMLGDRLAIEPSIYGRLVLAVDAPLSIRNFIGGEYFGRYYSQQMPFAGINNITYAENKAIISGLKIRQRLTENQYVTLTGNVGIFGERFYNLSVADPIFGIGATYAYDTFLGPMSATFSWSNETKKVGFYLGVGFNF